MQRLNFIENKTQKRIMAGILSIIILLVSFTWDGFVYTTKADDTEYETCIVKTLDFSTAKYFSIVDDVKGNDLLS